MAFTIQKDPITNKDILTGYKGSDAVVVIPDGVYRIGKKAFGLDFEESGGTDASYLQSVIIPRGVSVIDRDAFLNSSLHRVSLPEGLLSIGREAFCGCIHLTDLHIPDSVEFIGSGAFMGCYALKHIRLPQNSSCVIEDYAFEEANIAQLTIPGGIQTIQQSCFSDCKNLKHVTILDGVKQISSAAFDNCRKLTDVEIPPSVETIEEIAFGTRTNSKDLKVTIHGAPRSAAETFAKAHSFPFVSTSPQSENSAAGKSVRAAGASVKQDKTKPVPPPAASGPPKSAAAANQYERRVAELKKRYAGKPVPSTLQQFRAENKDIDFAAFSDWVREAHGSTPAKFLTEQGLMARATAAKIPETTKVEAAPRDSALAALYGRETFKYNNKVTFYLPPGFSSGKDAVDLIISDDLKFPISLKHAQGVKVDKGDSKEPVLLPPGFILDFYTKKPAFVKYIKIPGPPYAMFVTAITSTGHLADYFLTSLSLELYVETGELDLLQACTLVFLETDDLQQNCKAMLELAKALRVNGKPLCLDGIDEKVLNNALKPTAEEVRRKKIILGINSY